jgi:hypothetical protein
MLHWLAQQYAANTGTSENQSAMPSQHGRQRICCGGATLLCGTRTVGAKWVERRTRAVGGKRVERQTRAIGGKGVERRKRTCGGEKEQQLARCTGKSPILIDIDKPSF